jgi:DNA/RNA-binding protein KIN17
MPKAEKGTPKDIANRMKAKGLQKLKFYCQMCSKQCRDENGFKCHLTSDSHLRNMSIFRDNASGIMDDFSAEFEKSYVDVLRRRHGTQRMNANNVYQEVIMDKHHVHMNSTKWATLTDFVQYLGKKGICIVEETERGWYVTYIERDPALLARQEALKKKAEADKREEQLAAERREVMRMEAAKALDRAGGVVERLASEIGPRGGGDGVVEMKLGATTTISSSQPKKKKRKGNSGAILSLVEEDEDDDNDDAKQGNESMQVSKNNNRHQMEIDMHASSKGVTMNVSKRDDEARKTNGNSNNNMAEKREHKEYHDDDYSSTKKKDYWLYRDIIVRIINKKLSNGQYYKRKAIVDKVIDKYEAEVEVLESSRKANDGGDILRLDQDDLETVIPKELGEKVRILVGKHRGKKARVLSLNKMDYQAELRLSDDDRVVTLNYEDFSKLA